MKISLSILLLIGSASAVSLGHHRHHHHHKDTYPAKDSHSKVVPYIVRDHAWNHAEEDHTNDATWQAETEAQAGAAYSVA